MDGKNQKNHKYHASSALLLHLVLQSVCTLSTAQQQQRKSPSILPGASQPMTASNLSKNTPAEILPPITTSSLLSILFLPFSAGTQLQSPQGFLAKHKNSIFVSLLLQIGSTEDVHFHALCLLQLFKRSLYARKHKLIHKPTGHFMTKEMEIKSFKGNV